MNEKRKDNDNGNKQDVEVLIQELLEKWKGNRMKDVTAAGELRTPPGLTEPEKFCAAQNALISDWYSRPTNAETLLNQPGFGKKIDKLLISVMDNSVLWQTITEIINVFGAEPETIMKLIILEKKWCLGSISLALKAVKVPDASEEAKNFVIKWAMEIGHWENAIEIAEIRKEPGLIESEINEIFNHAKETGNVALVIKLADMKKKPGLTGQEIGELISALAP